jgi:hypothetical protein
LDIVDNTFPWLDQTGWAAVSAIASVATFVGGLIAVLVAFNQIRSARKIHDDQVRPYVIVDIEPNLSSWMLQDLVIRNIGQTAAVECRIQLDPRPTRAVDQNTETLGDAKVLNEPISMLAPGREIRLFFDSLSERIGTDLPMQYTATVTYKSHATKEHWTETYTLDVAALLGVENFDVFTIHHVAETLRDLHRDLRKSPLLKGSVEVVTEDRATRHIRLEQEYKERVRQYEEQGRKAQTETHEDGADQT